MTKFAPTLLAAALMLALIHSGAVPASAQQGGAGGTARAIGWQGTSAGALPRPTGPHPVGTYGRSIVDPARREIFTRDPADHRRLPLFVYYPAARSCAPSPFIPAALADVYAAELQLRRGYEREVLGHACANAPPARGLPRRPLVIFSHGLQFNHFFYRSIIEDLASHGHVVVAIDHPYGGRATQFPAGAMVRWDNSRWHRGEDEARYAAARREFYRIWADDSRTVLDRIINDASGILSASLRKNIDFNRIAYLGHSYGGMSAIHAAQRDHRIKAAANLDGGLVDRVNSAIEARLLLPVEADVPVLALNSEANEEREYYGRNVRVARVRGSNHMTFSDVVWLVERARPSEPNGVPAPMAPDALTGEQGISLTRRILSLFLGCAFESSCARLDDQLQVVRSTPAKGSPTGAQ